MDKENKKLEAAQKANELALKEMKLRVRATLKLMEITNNILGIKPKSNKDLSFEYHDRIKDERE